MIGYSKTPTAPYVVGAALMGANGEITNATGDFKLYDKGFEIPAQSSYSKESAYVMNDATDGDVGRIYGVTGNETLNIDTTGSWSIRLSAGQQTIIENDFRFQGGTESTFLEVRDVYPNSSTPASPGVAGLRIYAKEDADGFTRPVYRRDNGDEFFLDTGNAV